MGKSHLWRKNSRYIATIYHNWILQIVQFVKLVVRRLVWKNPDRQQIGSCLYLKPGNVSFDAAEPTDILTKLYFIVMLDFFIAVRIIRVEIHDRFHITYPGKGSGNPARVRRRFLHQAFVIDAKPK